MSHDHYGKYGPGRNEINRPEKIEVRGHWRTLANGKRVWVPAHMKGWPKDGPKT